MTLWRYWINMNKRLKKKRSRYLVIDIKSFSDINLRYESEKKNKAARKIKRQMGETAYDNMITDYLYDVLKDSNEGEKV